MHELIPDIEDVHECWALGVQPLVDAYGPEISPLLQAVIYSHRENFPVPVFITGSARARATELLQAVNDLTGGWGVIDRRITTLPALRLAAEPRQPLLVDHAAPGASTSGDSMFDLIDAEVLDYGSPLQEVNLLVATGGRRVSRELRTRTLTISLTSPGPSGATLRRLTSTAASDARQLVQIHLQQTANRGLTPKARRLVLAAADTSLPPTARRSAALDATATLQHAMELPPMATPEDPVLGAIRTALTNSLDEPAVAGTLGDSILYAVPQELLPRIRTAANDPSITNADVVRSLEAARMLPTQTMNSARRGNTTPTRLGSTVRRVWRIRAELIR